MFFLTDFPKYVHHCDGACVRSKKIARGQHEASVVADRHSVCGGCSARSGQDAKACSAIDDSLQRLTCFDSLFPRTAAGAATPDKAPPAAPPAVIWHIEEDKSPLDDSIKFTAGLSPKTVTTSGIGDAEMYLVVRCAENTTSVVFVTSMFMISERPTVTIRVGDEPARTERWSRSTNYKAVGLWSGGEAIPFLKRLKDNVRLAVRIEDKDRVDAEFDLGDVSAHIQKIRGYCKW